MNKKHFGELLGSLDEAVEIARALGSPHAHTPLASRTFVRSVGRLA